jgi:dihydrolipoamide dehydrogenase
MTVVCIEAEQIGGVCLNIGCIPTKALLTSALFVNDLKNAAAHGVVTGEVSVDLGPAQARSRKVAKQLSRGVQTLFKRKKVDHLAGYGRLAGAGKVEVEDADGGKTMLSGKHVILATGSRPRDIPSFPIDEELIWSSTGALMQTSAPARLAVIGAGAVGMEFADVYASYGSTVTVIEALDRVLPLEDRDCSDLVAKSYKKRGIDVMLGASVKATELHEDSVTLTVQAADGSEQKIEVDRVLSAVGRVPNTEDLGLDTVGVARSERGGFVEVDELLRTNVPGVYAIGDCAGHQLLAHKASHEGITCVEHMAGVGHGTVDYANVPNCTYCHPEVASVGLTEEQAVAAGHDVEVGKFPWVGNGRALAMGDANGFVKVIRDKKYSEILGAHIVGPHATELISEFVIGRHLESTMEEMEKAMHPHPTLSEAVAEGALAALGRAIHI